jgi:hypothetical protein
MTQYPTFADFYPFYLSEHANRTCRALHFVGSTLVLVVLAATLLTQRWWWLVAIPFVGYGFAWIGHFFFEKNRPATFTHPVYSLMGDWVMFGEIIKGRIKL